MHRNHVYVCEKIKAIADRLQQLAELSSVDTHNSNGVLLCHTVDLVDEELKAIRQALDRTS